MLNKIRIKLALAATFGLLALAGHASAHEAYVLPHNEFVEGLHDTSVNVWNALKIPQNINIVISVAFFVSVLMAADIVFRRTKIGERFTRLWERGVHMAPVILRLAVGVSLIYSAITGSFLGPEVSLATFPFGQFLQPLLLIIGVMITLGLFTELAALVAIGFFTLAVISYHLYLMTYLNYLAEFILLLCVGARKYSFDGILFGPGTRFHRLRHWEPVILRMSYGFILSYAAISVKLMHSILPLEVVNRYNLTQFHFLFPHDPLLIVLGAGIVELVIGMFVFFGFEMRLALLVSLFYMTLSLLFFKEAVWPHFILYGLSFYLLLTPERFALDNIFFRRTKW